MALEQSFLGQRFGDLQRIALRRDDTDFLARKIAGRAGKDSFNQNFMVAFQIGVIGICLWSDAIMCCKSMLIERCYKYESI